VEIVVRQVQNMH